MARLLSRLLLPPAGREVIQGDLEELFRWRVRTRGVFAAKRWYWRASVASIGATLLRSRGSHEGVGPKRKRVRGGGMLSGFGMDIRFAWRSLWRRPGFTALAVLTLAVGIGANTTVFSMVNQVLYRPLPGVSDTEPAVFVEMVDRDGRRRGGGGLSPPNFEDVREAATLFEALAGFGGAVVYAAVGEGRPVELRAHTIRGEYFEALGVRPVVGRLLRAQETAAHSDPSLVVISERLWSTLFARAPDVVGRPLRANGQTLTVIGVAGGGFAGPWRGTTIDLWLPLSALTTVVGFPPALLQERSSGMLGDLVGRLKPGVAAAAAESQLREATARLAETYPEENRQLTTSFPRVWPGVEVRPLLREHTESTVRRLLGVVGLLLAVACANVANLLLLRGVRRRAELAVRRALGASRGRVVFQLLAETCLLAGMGGVAGVAFAYGLSELFRGASLAGLPAFEGLAPDVRVLGFALGAVMLVAMVGGATPAWMAARAGFSAGLREAGRRDTGGRGALRSAMTVVQLALSLTLLVGSLLLVRTVRNLYAVDLGLDPAGIITFSVNASPAGYSTADVPALKRRLFEALRVVPGVDALAFDVYAPFSGIRFGGSLRAPGEEERTVRIEQRYATPGYFEALDIRLIAGRGFRAEDWTDPASDRIVITNTLARELFGDADPIGRIVTTAPPREESFTVVGVTSDVRMMSPAEEPAVALFRVVNAASLPLLTVMVRTKVPGAALTEALRQALWSVAPDIPVGEPVALADMVDERIGEPRLFARLLTALSVLAVFLAAIGLYGVIAWTVAERTRELGIRMALGARAARIARLVLKRAAVLVGASIAAGLAGAFWLGRVLRSQLFAIEPVDAGTYVAAALLFAAVALAACLGPMLSATRVDPAVALRQE